MFAFQEVFALYLFENNITMSKQSESGVLTSKNRCLSAIPNFKIPYKFLEKRINKYTYSKTIVEAMLNHNFDYKNDGIEFGSFNVKTVDFHLLIAYMEARKEKSIKDNTILRELSTLSGAFDRIYKYFPEQFPDSVINPVKMLPRNEKPKQYLGRKRVLNEIEAKKIAEWLSLKTNQEPYYVFVQCLFSGARKSEVLGMQWQNIDFQSETIFLPKTKNGRPRSIQIESTFLKYLSENKKVTGNVFRLTHFNFRQYWVDALKAMDMYDNQNERLHFHDTRRSAITKEISMGENNLFNIAKKFGVKPNNIEQIKQNMPENMLAIFTKMRNGEKLTEEEIMKIFGHSNINTTEIYNGNRN